jgi:hypothetical protein
MYKPTQSNMNQSYYCDDCLPIRLLSWVRRALIWDTEKILVEAVSRSESQGAKPEFLPQDKLTFGLSVQVNFVFSLSVDRA